MCTVGQKLSGAITGVREAVIEERFGNLGRAVELATTARADAEDAHMLLQSVGTEAIRPEPAWQALLLAYAQTGQAANSMLPGFENTHGLAIEELMSAEQALANADAALPVQCMIPVPSRLTNLAGRPTL